MRTEVWLALMATMTWGASASAMPPDAERLKTAAEEFDAGRRAYKLRDFENSAIHFENADRDAPSPEALQSAIRGRKEAGQAARAATLSALGLARYPNDKSFGEYARQVLAESERGLHKVSIGCSPECTLIVDNKVMPFGETSNAVVYVEPGAHAVVAGWSNNRHKNADVAAVAAGTSKIAFTAPAIEKTPAPEPPPAPEPATPRDPAEIEKEADLKKTGLPPAVFFVGAGATVILGGVTAWSGLDTLKNPGTAKVTEDCAPPNNTPECPTYKEGLAHQLRTNVLLGATGVVGVTTAVIGLFLTKWGSDSPKTAKKDAYVMPVVGVSDGVTLGAVGRF